MSAVPLFSTPRTLSRKTMAAPAAKIARLLGIDLMPWQSEAVELFTELDDAELLVFSDITLLVPRQSGKSTLLLILLLLRALGAPGSRCGYGAQSLKDARKMLLEVWVPLLDASPLKGTYTVRAANGSEAVRFSNGSAIELLVSTSTKAQHGQVWDFAVLDEAFSQVDSRVETSILPAFATRTTRKPGVQWMVVSTAGTRAASPYLLERVESRRQLVTAGVTTGTAFIEYAAPDGADYADPEVWRACNPALAITITEAAVKAEMASLGEAEFRRSRLCQWTTQQADPVIPIEVWEALCDPQSVRGSSLVLAFDSTPDGTSASITIASKREDGRKHIEVVESESGTGWLAAAVERLVRTHEPDVVICDPKNPAARALPALELADITVLRVLSGDITASFAGFTAAAMEGTLVHIGQPELTAALTGAVRRSLGDAFAWSRRSSSVDISSLVAASLALWALDNLAEREPRIFNLIEYLDDPNWTDPDDDPYDVDAY